MNTHGVTLIELMVGFVTAVVIGAASAGLIKAGIMTYTFSTRQNEALTGTRKAVQGEGAAAGILPSGRGAYAVNALSAASVDVLSSTSSVLTSYYLSGGSLFKSKDGVGAKHADAVTAVAVNYYNMDGDGLIVESTSTAGAWLVTALVTVQGKTSQQKDHKLFSGTLLRNKQ